MNRETLRKIADSEGIRRDSYSLDGGMPSERYVLAIIEGGWAVYYSERRSRNGESRFETEDEACDELLMRLIRDPTTRIRRDSREAGKGNGVPL